MPSFTLSYTFDELCEVAELSSEIIVEIVEHGIVDPEGDAPDNWLFSAQMITVTKKAYRLHRDLEIDWQGIAVSLKLLDEMEQLEAENQALKLQLEQFLSGRTKKIG